VRASVSTASAAPSAPPDENSGKCAGACAIETLGLSYIGCDYYPTTLVNLHETQPWNFNYAVVVANTTDVTANITITRGPNPVTTDTVGPNTAKVINLPYVDQLVKPTINESGPTLVVTDGAYRLRSDPAGHRLPVRADRVPERRPLLVHQRRQPAAPRQHLDRQLHRRLAQPLADPGLQPARLVRRRRQRGRHQVTLKPSARPAASSPPAAASPPTAPASSCSTRRRARGLHRQRRRHARPRRPHRHHHQADKPVQVFGGHKCTQVPSAPRPATASRRPCCRSRPSPRSTSSPRR
jgi:hypothetical protein